MGSDFSVFIGLFVGGLVYLYWPAGRCGPRARDTPVGAALPGAIS